MMLRQLILEEKFDEIKNLLQQSDPIKKQLFTNLNKEKTLTLQSYEHEIST
jgi:hypothetical protein